MPTTSNFGWTTPADTDLVKDGALAIRTLGNGIDTSFVDLKGGTTGQILSKASNTDLDYTWINNDQGDITGVTAGTGISGGGTSGTVTITNSMATEITAAGDIIVGTGSGTFDNLPIGTTGQVLTADTTVSPYKVKWASSAAAGGLTKITTSAFSGATSVSVNGCFTSTYRNYVIVIDNLNSGSNASDVYLQFQYSTSTVQATSYYCGAYYMKYDGTTGNYNRSNSTSITMGQFTDLPAGIVVVNVTCVGASSQRVVYQGSANGANSGGVSIFGGNIDSLQTYTGIKISASNNISGNVTVYGWEK